MKLNKEQKALITQVKHAMEQRAIEIARDYQALRWEWNGDPTKMPAVPRVHEIFIRLQDLLSDAVQALNSGSIATEIHSGGLYVEIHVNEEGCLHILFGYAKNWEFST